MFHRPSPPYVGFPYTPTTHAWPDSWWLAGFSAAQPQKKGLLRHQVGMPSGRYAPRGANSRTYCGATALVPTPPAADFTQTVVGRRAVVPRNAQRPSAALTLVVAMRAPGHVVPTAPPLWTSTLAAKPPPVIRVLVPSTRSAPVFRSCSAR